jgi:CRISPR/Cas system-associated endonuclease Cas1
MSFMPGTSATATPDAPTVTTHAPTVTTHAPTVTTHAPIDDAVDEAANPDGGDVLAVDIPGAFIGKRSERLQVRVAGEVVAEAPLFRLRQVIMGSRGVSISSDAIQACARRDITIHVVGRWPGDAAMLGAPVGNATVATRRAQFAASESGRGDHLARRIVWAKVRTQATLLRYLVRSRRDAEGPADALRHAIAILDRLAAAIVGDAATPESILLDATAALGNDDGATGMPDGTGGAFADLGAPPRHAFAPITPITPIASGDGGDVAPPGIGAEAHPSPEEATTPPADDRPDGEGDAPPTPMAAALRGVEGSAGRTYWRAIGAVLADRGVAWPGRQYRGTTCPTNAALNYGYAILGTAVHQAILLAGLEPGAGFLHADRPGRSSLVLDAIEEFRQAAVDRPLVGLLARGVRLEMDDSGTRLNDEARRTVADAVLDRLDAAEAYAGARYPLRGIITRQAQQVATYLRGDRADYLPWVPRW